MKSLIGLVALLVAIIGMSLPVSAQTTCKTTSVNLQGTAGADITVSSTAVAVMENNPARCAMILKNNHATNSMRCMASVQGAPTSTAGVLLAAGEQMKLSGTASAGAWRCIRVTSDAAAQVVETTP